LVRHEIAQLLIKGLKDPRIGFVSVMAVRMSPDLCYANVYVSLYGTEAERKSSLIGLQHSAGWIRREVGKHLRTRVTPEIRFFPDDTLDQVYHLEEVFQEIHEEQHHTPMIKLDLEQIVEEFRKAGSLLVTSHVSPDGDAVGSMLAIYYLLRALGKEQVTCVLADPVPRLYRTLPGAAKIVRADTEKPDFDTAVLVDVGQMDRIGAVATWIPDGTRIVVIDHHLAEGPPGAAGFIDASYASVGEIVAELFEVAGVPLSIEAAHCAYVAQVTDTGSYRFSNTTPRSHRIAAVLQESGIDTAAICAEVFDVMSKPKFELLRRVLDRIQFAGKGRVAHTYVTAQDLAELDAKKDDLDGLVNFPRNIDGVQAGVLFHAVKPERTKVSLRCKKGFDAAEFLSRYEGGGHAAAAGATVDQPLDRIQPALIEALVNALGANATGVDL